MWAPPAGRNANRLLVVVDEADQARDVLERVLANERADTPAVAQRRQLRAQMRGARSRSSDRRSAEDALVVARRVLDEARQRAEPHLRAFRQAEADLNAAEADLRASHAALADAPLLRRRRATQRVVQATDVVGDSRARRDAAADAAAPYVVEIDAAAPYVVEIDAAEAHVREAERELSSARIRERLDRLTLGSPARSIERDVGIVPPGL